MLTALIRGAGDLATGAALSLHHAGLRVVMSELPQPLAIRRTVAFAEAVYRGAHTVEGVRAELCGAEEWAAVCGRGGIPVVVDAEAQLAALSRPDVFLDAVMAKRSLGTTAGCVPLIIALGPGFQAGTDVDAVVETMRGHELGRIIRHGPARQDTGIPGEIAGKSAERVLRSPAAGTVESDREIGDLVEEGDVIARVSGNAVRAPFAGCLRGLIHPGIQVPTGIKIADVDPRGDPAYCWLVSDKARAVGRAVLEAVLMIGRERGLFSVRSGRDAQ
jgi:xanthine dehydrogenase accessory factor